MKVPWSYLPQQFARIDEILVVSDGSNDRTVEIARDLGVRTIHLRENQGKGMAMAMGVEKKWGEAFEGLAQQPPSWYHSRRGGAFHPAIFAASPVRVAPVEELIWHRLFISERHRQDMSDILHLILCQGSRIDWDRLVEKTGENWPLLLAQLQMFAYVYPEARSHVPPDIIDMLLERSRGDFARHRSGELMTRGPLISRFSFSIDVNEWGMTDLRERSIRAKEQLPIIREIAASDVWEEHSDMTRDYLRRYQP